MSYFSRRAKAEQLSQRRRERGESVALQQSAAGANAATATNKKDSQWSPKCGLGKKFRLLLLLLSPSSFFYPSRSYSRTREWALAHLENAAMGTLSPFLYARHLISRPLSLLSLSPALPGGNIPGSSEPAIKAILRPTFQDLEEEGGNDW